MLAFYPRSHLNSLRELKIHLVKVSRLRLGSSEVEKFFKRVCLAAMDVMVSLRYARLSRFLSH